MFTFAASGRAPSLSRSLAAAFQQARGRLRFGATTIFRKYSLYYTFQFTNKTAEENQARKKFMWKHC